LCSALDPENGSVDVATKWYYDDGGKDVAELRKKITEGWVSIIPGYKAE